MRSGTENVESILGLGVALKTAVDELEERRQHIDMIRDYFVEQLRENFLGIRLNGNHEKQQYLFTVLNVAFPTTLPVNLLLFKLDLGGISASGGSACNSGAVSKSRVLQQFDIPSEYQSVRFSFSHYNTKAEIDQTIIILKKTLGNT
jgi:cysteine desulfurase